MNTNFDLSLINEVCLKLYFYIKNKEISELKLIRIFLGIKIILKF